MSEGKEGSFSAFGAVKRLFLIIYVVFVIKIMKYFITIFFVFFVFLPTPVVTAIQGTVPKLEPLQPIPEDSFPNVSKNINFKTETSAQTDDNSEKLEDEKILSGKDGGELIKKNNLDWFSPSRIFSTENGLIKNTIFVLFLILVLTAGTYYFKRGK